MSKSNAAVTEEMEWARLFVEQLPRPVEDGWIFPSERRDDRAVAFPVMLRSGANDFLENRRRSFMHAHGFEIGRNVQWQPPSPFPMELGNGYGLVACSPSGRFLASVRSLDSGKSGSTGAECSQVIDIYQGAQLFRTIRPKKQHGKILTDGWFGDLSWSPDERSLVYIAEETPSSREAWWDADPAQPPSDQPESSSDDSTTPFSSRKFAFAEDWGECHVGISRPKPFVADISTGRVRAVPTPTGGCGDDDVPLSFGQPTFSPEGKWIVCTGWTTWPRRLGMIYCFNRPCALFALHIGALWDEENKERDAGRQCVCLTPDRALARSARFNRAGTKLVFLSGKPMAPHNGPSELSELSWELWLSSEWATESLGEDAARDATKPWRHSPDGFPFPPALRPEWAVLERRTVVPVPALSQAGIPCDRLEVGGTGEPSERLCPALYAHAISRNAWSHDDTHVFLNCVWGSDGVILRVEVATGRLAVLGDSCNPTLSTASFRDRAVASGVPIGEAPQRLFPDNRQPHSLTLLDARPCETDKAGDSAVRDLLLVSASSPVSPDVAAIIGLDATGHVVFVRVTPERPRYVDDTPAPALARDGEERPTARDVWCRLASLVWDEIIVDVPRAVALGSMGEGEPSTDANSTTSFSSVLLRPAVQSDATIPLLLWPHGGPHSMYPACFLGEPAFFASLGFAVLVVNYRGSIGAPVGDMYSLPGRAGRQDVDDCMAALRAVLHHADTIGVDPSRISAMGGSHGGFIGAHLVGQFADTFRTAVLRNPVTNVAGMVSVTDIPDWCHVEAIGCDAADADRFRAPSCAALQRMWDVSPVAHVENVRAPVLFTVGAKDRRVPLSQSIEFCETLRSQGVTTKMLLYPEDSHGLASPEARVDGMVHILRWLRTHA